MGLIERLATALQPVLAFPLIRRVRRNHALEHATIHLLARGRSRLRLAGRSDDRGFFLYGDVSTGEVEQAVDEALRRLRAGEHEIAIHPNCGTNLVTTGVLAALAALLGAAGTERTWRDRLERFPTVVLMVIAALLFGPGVAPSLQRHITTLGDPGEMEVIEIRRSEVRTLVGNRQLTIHRVETRGG